ncbi:MAG: hypothetical protein M5U01_08370 [Ardenticatenaceae bacterium]|nr:hypothetical protein [Ardenticatenaceae bacterium]HBY92364.1 hypothetical protein [Chloroflexota bacterium]
MPEFQKLSREEIEALTPGKKPSQRARIREEYQNFLRDIHPGEGGEVQVAEGENRTTIRNRLKAAAKALDKKISFLRTRGDILRFRVEA